jgi:hypothetical protein
MTKEIDFNQLLEEIKNKRCTAFLGAGACYPSLPLGAELAEGVLRLWETSRNATCPLATRTDLARVAQFIAVADRDGSSPKHKVAEYLQERIRKKGPPNFHSAHEPHRVLAACQLPVYITTNYDDFMFQVLEQAKVKPVREFARWTRYLLDRYPSKLDRGFQPSAEAPLVFHLHGDLEKPETMVVSDDDYLDFLVNLSKDLALFRSRRPAIVPACIRRALTEHRLLFIGYSLSDINFRVILRGLVGSLERGQRRLHLAVQVRDPSDAMCAYLKDYFDWSLDIQVYWGTAQEFCAELGKRLPA